MSEPNGFMVPQPANPAEVACCVTGRGYPADAADLSGLFAFRNDPMVDWERDALTGPGVFSPLCGFSGALVLRGGACAVDFGWYNVTGSGVAPSDDQIHTIIPRDDPDVYGKAGMPTDFCPLAGVTTNPGEMGKCQVKTFDAADIRSDMRYQGGLIGFAIKGNPNSLCRQTHYSQNELHPQCTNCTPAAPWIMSLIYESKATPDSFYLAFEDQPAPGPNQTFGPNQPNDGDFNDFVFFISGVTCEGGGQVCDLSATRPELKGVCAVGRTGCAMGGMPAPCNPVVEPGTESCDNLDNDCNGLVDDGNLCNAGQVCDRGTCVSSCSGGEFRCPLGLECNALGYCVDPSCKEVTCEAGQVCRNGTCTGGCGGNVVCPAGQECQLGRCVDLCAAVDCAENQVCERGVCISSCSCRPCLAGKTCAADGRCVDTGCEAKTCPPGNHCVAGECVDRCSGVVCPGGAECVMGECGEPIPGNNTGTGGTTGGPPIGSGGFVIQPGGGRNPAGGNAPTAGGQGVSRGTPDDEGCGCRTVSASSNGAFAGVALAGLVALFRRRRVRGRSN